MFGANFYEFKLISPLETEWTTEIVWTNLGGRLIWKSKTDEKIDKK